MIRDRNIEWRRKKIYINAMHFTGTIGTTVNVGLGTGGPIAEEINSLDLGAMNMAVVLDEFIHYMAVPYDVDPTYSMGIRCNWVTSSSTDAADFVFLGLMDFKARNAPVVKPVTVLDTIIPATTVGTAAAYAQHWTERGIKNAGFLTREEVQEGLAWMCFEISITTIDDTDSYLLGVLLDYVPRLTEGYAG